MTALFMLGYLAFPVLAIAYMEFSRVSIFRFSIPSFTILCIFMLGYIGLGPLYLQMDPRRVELGVVDESLIMIMLLCTCLAIIGLVTGYMFVRVVLRLSHAPFPGSPFRPLRGLEFTAVAILFAIGLGTLFLYMAQIPKIALLASFTESTQEVQVARSAMGNDFGGKYHWYRIGMRDLLNLVTYVALANFLIGRRWRSLLFLIVCLVPTLFSLVLATERSPLGWMLIGAALVVIAVVSDGVYPIKKLVVLSAGMLLLLSAYQLYVVSAADFWDAFWTIGSRILTGGITPAYYYLEFFPAEQDFLWGRSLPNPAGIFPFENYRLTVEVLNWRFPADARAGIIGSAPTMFWGEAYANFGYAGVLIVPFYLGTTVALIAHLISRLDNSPLKVGITVWIAVRYKDIAVTGFSEFLFDIGMYLMIAAALLPSLLAYGGKLKFSLGRRD